VEALPLCSPLLVAVSGFTWTPQRTHLMSVTEVGFGQLSTFGAWLGSRSK
jgi:hypothetical protein